MIIHPDSLNNIIIFFFFFIVVQIFGLIPDTTKPLTIYIIKYKIIKWR